MHIEKLRRSSSSSRVRASSRTDRSRLESCVTCHFWCKKYIPRSDEEGARLLEGGVSSLFSSRVSKFPRSARARWPDATVQRRRAPGERRAYRAALVAAAAAGDAATVRALADGSCPPRCFLQKTSFLSVALLRAAQGDIWRRSRRSRAFRMRARTPVTRRAWTCLARTRTGTRLCTWRASGATRGGGRAARARRGSRCAERGGQDAHRRGAARAVSAPPSPRRWSAGETLVETRRPLAHETIPEALVRYRVGPRTTRTTRRRSARGDRRVGRRRRRRRRRRASWRRWCPRLPARR